MTEDVLLNPSYNERITVASTKFYKVIGPNLQKLSERITERSENYS